MFDPISSALCLRQHGNFILFTKNLLVEQIFCEQGMVCSTLLEENFFRGQ